MKPILYSLMLLAINVVAGCSTQTPTQAPATEAPKPTPIIVDVRSAEEWDSGHLEQAVHIPHDQIAERISAITTDKNAPIVLHCKAGGRAGKAQQTLVDMGYTDVQNAGGYEDARAKFGDATN